MEKKKVIIIGAGPAGLTMAHEMMLQFWKKLKKLVEFQKL